MLAKRICKMLNDESKSKINNNILEGINKFFSAIFTTQAGSPHPNLFQMDEKKTFNDIHNKLCNRFDISLKLPFHHLLLLYQFYILKKLFVCVRKVCVCIIYIKIHIFIISGPFSFFSSSSFQFISFGVDITLKKKQNKKNEFMMNVTTVRQYH
jgi:hypothetical protein